MLAIDHVIFAYDGTPVIRDVSFDVGEGEVICLLGPSGCGKTTLLRLIAGLETEYEGDIRLNGAPLKSVPVHQRKFGYMFQDFALFPHMTVAENIQFGLKMRPYDKSRLNARVAEVLELVGLGQFGSRDVNELSGGEKQRVALARSLAPNPKLLMLDEPLGSLDAALRRRLMIEIRRIIKSVGVTAIYVTHDQEEAFSVADRIVLMNAGRVEQIDSPLQLYKSPRTEFAARFLGMQSNIVSAADIETWVPLPSASQLMNNQTKFLIHPAGIQLPEQPGSMTLAGVVTACTFRGASYHIIIQVADKVDLSFEISSFSSSIPKLGESIAIYLAKDAVLPLLQD